MQFIATRMDHQTLGRQLFRGCLKVWVQEEQQGSSSEALRRLYKYQNFSLTHKFCEYLGIRYYSTVSAVKVILLQREIKHLQPVLGSKKARNENFFQVKLV